MEILDRGSSVGLGGYIHSSFTQLNLVKSSIAWYYFLKKI